MRIVTITLILLTLACSKKEAVEPDPTGAAGAPSSAEESPEAAVAEPPPEIPELPPALLQAATPPLSAPPAIAVLNQGAEPREALRWQLEAGFEQKSQLKIGYTVTAVVMVLQVGDPSYFAPETFARVRRVEAVHDHDRLVAHDEPCVRAPALTQDRVGTR